jgi:Rrf2 family protein
MALYGSNAEYALHCLLFLVPLPAGQALSARDLAECQGISPSLVAKLFTGLQKAGIVVAQEGVHGGFSLAKAAEQISMLDVIDAAEGRKRLFDCKEIRAKCVLFGGCAPEWATRGLCDINAAMIAAERAMRSELARRTLADLAGRVGAKMPADFAAESARWLERRAATRGRAHAIGGA